MFQEVQIEAEALQAPKNSDWLDCGSIEGVVDEYPEYYLDEIAEELLARTQIHLTISTIYKILIEKLGYSLRVCYASVLQQNNSHRRLYKRVLKYVGKDPR